LTNGQSPESLGVIADDAGGKGVTAIEILAQEAAARPPRRHCS
jgi:hypothetical protein